MYCTVDELINERLTGGSYDYLSVERAIMDASDTIDMRLSGYYTTPFNPVPASIRRLCLDLACCNLMRTNKAMLAQSRDELASTQYICDKAEKDLEKLAKGKNNITQQRRGTSRIAVYSGKDSYMYVEE